jgi:hypothetical protein
MSTEPIGNSEYSLELGDDAETTSSITLKIFAARNNPNYNPSLAVSETNQQYAPYYMWNSGIELFKLDHGGDTFHPSTNQALSPLQTSDFGMITINPTGCSQIEGYPYRKFEKNGKHDQISLSFSAPGDDLLVGLEIFVKFTCLKRNGEALEAKWGKLKFVDIDGGLINVVFNWE